jgi:hypothetical protein
MRLHIFFFSNSDRDFYSENNNVSQVYTYIPKIHKKKRKKTLLSSMFQFALNIGGIFAQSHMLLFVICFSSYLNLVITFSPVNRDIKMAPPCKRYRKVYTWQVSSIIIINIAEFATLGVCRSLRHTGE